jgi:hypothetical protein
MRCASNTSSDLMFGPEILCGNRSSDVPQIYDGGFFRRMWNDSMTAARILHEFRFDGDG